MAGPASFGDLATGSIVYAVNFALVVGLAAVGAAITERSGVLNLGHEGVMLLGAAAGFAVAVHTTAPWLGLLGGIGAGLALGVVKAIWSVVLGTEQVINGLMLVPIGIGLSSVLFAHQFGHLPAPPQLPAAAPLAVPGLARMPLLGPVLLDHPPLLFAALVAAAAIYWHARTRAGLVIRAVGESPDTVAFAGLSVRAWRFVAVLIGTALTGLAGAVLAVDQLRLFHPGMTAGRGWIAIAVVIVAGWRPGRCVLVALLFGALDMIQLQAQVESAPVPYELLMSLPYLATIVLLALRPAARRPPAALGRPYRGTGPAGRDDAG
jgi:simple sugar transport system permease protein